MTKNIWLCLLLIIAACISTALLVHSRRHSLHRPTHLNQKPDAFMTDASYFEYDKQGNLHSHLSTTKILHYRSKNSSRFEHPKMMVYTDQHVPWYVSADHGRSHDGVKWVYLWDHVSLHQPDRPNNPETTINTSEMTVFPTKSFAKTDQNVTIVRPGSAVEATGMHADFKRGVITLLSHSRGVYESTKPHVATHSDSKHST